MSHPSSSIVAELAGMRTRAAEMTQTLWAAHEGGELMDLVAEIEALKSTLDAVELQVVRQLDATGAVRGAGWPPARTSSPTRLVGTRAPAPPWSASPAPWPNRD